jgi:hypothetical protein
MQAPDEARTARAAARRYTDFLFRFPNVLGAGVGRRVVGGDERDEWSLVVFVERKLPAALLTTDQLIPRELVTEEGIATTDLIEVTPPRLLVDTALYDPLIGGCQIGSAGGGGTLGGILYDGTDDQPVLLTCNHCLTLPGQRMYIPQDARVRQPIGGPEASIGTTKRIVPMLPGPLGASYAFEAVVDAGIVAPNFLRDLSFRVIELGRHPYVVLPAFPGLEVMKRGATTELTPGTVKHIDVAFVFTEPANGQRIRIGGADCVFSINRVGDNFAMPGDSGALVIDADRGAVRGMVFAGETQRSGFTFACDMDAIVRSLQLETPCAGGLRSVIRRAMFKRRIEVWAIAKAESAGIVGHMARNVEMFRRRYLANAGEGHAGLAIELTLQRLATDLAEAVNDDEDVAGLLELAFGEWLVQPTVFDMLEYRLPPEFGTHVLAALDRLARRSPEVTRPAWLPVALSACAGMKVREILDTRVAAAP